MPSSIECELPLEEMTVPNDEEMKHMRDRWAMKESIVDLVIFLRKLKAYTDMNWSKMDFRFLAEDCYERNNR